MSTFYIFDKFLQYQNDGTAVVDFNSDTIKVCLLTSSYTPNYTTHDYYPDLGNNEVSSAGYSKGGTEIVLTGTLDTTNHRYDLDASDIKWNGVTFAARYAVIYKHVDNTAVAPLVGCVDFGSDQNVTAGTFNLQWSASGVVRVAKV